MSRVTYYAMVMQNDYDALEAAAWDLHEAVSDLLDGERDEKRLRKAMNELGELLPAQRPADRESASNE